MSQPNVLDDPGYGYNFLANPAYHGHRMWDQWSIVDSTITNPPTTGGTGLYLTADRFFLAGSTIDLGETHALHCMRYPYLGKSIISNNDIARPAPGLLSIKLHAPSWCGDQLGMLASSCDHATDRSSPAAVSTPAAGQGHTRWVLIADNKFTGNNAWMVVVGPQNVSNDERVKDVILERNLFTSTATAAEVIRGYDVTVRNELWSLAGGGMAVIVRQDGITPPPSAVRISNNSYYSGFTSVANYLHPFLVDNTASSVTIQNNVAYAPNVSTVFSVRCQTSAPSMTAVDCATVPGFVASNNSTDTPAGGQIRNASPYAVAPPLSLVDWAPAGYASGSGASVPVFSDFFGNPRPQGGMDMGAIEVP